MLRIYASVPTYQRPEDVPEHFAAVLLLGFCFVLGPFLLSACSVLALFLLCYCCLLARLLLCSCCVLVVLLLISCSDLAPFLLCASSALLLCLVFPVLFSRCFLFVLAVCLLGACSVLALCLRCSCSWLVTRSLCVCLVPAQLVRGRAMFRLVPEADAKEARQCCSSAPRASRGRPV